MKQPCFNCLKGFEPDELWDYERKLAGYIEVGKVCTDCQWRVMQKTRGEKKE